MLEQYRKNCNLWEGFTLQKLVKDCLWWKGPQAGAGEGILPSSEEEAAAETIRDKLTKTAIPHLPVLMKDGRQGIGK